MYLENRIVDCFVDLGVTQEQLDKAVTYQKRTSRTPRENYGEHGSFRTRTTR